MNSSPLKLKSPRLKDYDGDLSRRWYIDYWVYNADTDAFDRQRHWLPMLKQSKQRKAYAKEALQEIERIIQSVYVEDTTKTFDVDRLTLREAVNYYLNYKNDTLEGYDRNKLCTVYNKESARIKFGAWKEYKNVLTDLIRWLGKQGLSDILLKNLNVQLCRSYMDHLKTQRQDISEALQRSARLYGWPV